MLHDAIHEQPLILVEDVVNRILNLVEDVGHRTSIHGDDGIGQEQVRGDLVQQCAGSRSRSYRAEGESSGIDRSQADV